MVFAILVTYMIVEVRVKPSSKIGPQVQLGLNRSLLVYVREPAIDGKANQAVIKILADYYKVSKSRVKFISGLTSRQKRFNIDL